MDIQKHQVLFIDIANSCASQMAEALMLSIAGDKFEPHSAGLEPALEIHPLTIESMADINIDITDHFPKNIKTYIEKGTTDFVIIVCDLPEKQRPEVSSSIPETHRYYWPIYNPASAVGSEKEQRDVFDRIRDELKDKIENLVAELDADPAL